MSLPLLLSDAKEMARSQDSRSIVVVLCLTICWFLAMMILTWCYCCDKDGVKSGNSDNNDSNNNSNNSNNVINDGKLIKRSLPSSSLLSVSFSPSRASFSADKPNASSSSLSSSSWWFRKRRFQWSNYPPFTKLRNVPILGTRDSLSYLVTNALGVLSRTQRHGLLDQLNEDGIRLLDIRLRERCARDHHYYHHHDEAKRSCNACGRGCVCCYSIDGNSERREAVEETGKVEATTPGPYVRSETDQESMKKVEVEVDGGDDGCDGGIGSSDGCNAIGTVTNDGMSSRGIKGRGEGNASNRIWREKSKVEVNGNDESNWRKNVGCNRRNRKSSSSSSGSRSSSVCKECEELVAYHGSMCLHVTWPTIWRIVRDWLRSSSSTSSLSSSFSSSSSSSPSCSSSFNRRRRRTEGVLLFVRYEPLSCGCCCCCYCKCAEDDDDGNVKEGVDDDEHAIRRRSNLLAERLNRRNHTIVKKAYRQIPKDERDSTLLTNDHGWTRVSTMTLADCAGKALLLNYDAVNDKTVPWFDNVDEIVHGSLRFHDKRTMFSNNESDPIREKLKALQKFYNSNNNSYNENDNTSENNNLVNVAFFNVNMPNSIRYTPRIVASTLNSLFFDHEDNEREMYGKGCFVVDWPEYAI